MTAYGPVTRLPPRPFLDPMLGRVVVVWAVLRASGAAGAGSMGVPAPASITGPPVATLWIGAAVVAVLLIDMRRRRELVFLANLGHSARRVSAVAAAATLVLDLALRALVV